MASGLEARRIRSYEIEGAGDRKDADHGGHGQACGHGHGWEPPRQPQPAPLLGVVDLVEGSVDHAIGQLVRAIDEVRVEESVEVPLIDHRRCPPATAVGRSSASMAARIARWA